MAYDPLQSYSIGRWQWDHLFLELELLRDPDAALDAHLAQDPENQELPEPPLYGLLWPAAQGLSHHLYRTRAEKLKGIRVLELGCGLGVPSLLAARLGAEVTAIDHHPHAIALLERNQARNGLSLKATAIASFTDPNLHLGTFDVILASDVLYEPKNYPALEDFILRHRDKEGSVLIADPGRYAMESFGSQLRRRMEEHRHAISLDGGSHPIIVLEYRAREGSKDKATP